MFHNVQSTSPASSLSISATSGRSVVSASVDVQRRPHTSVGLSSFCLALVLKVRGTVNNLANSAEVDSRVITSMRELSSSLVSSLSTRHLTVSKQAERHFREPFLLVY
jgi:hypothetical protein